MLIIPVSANAVLDVAVCVFFFFSSRRRHTRFDCDWSSDVCSSDLDPVAVAGRLQATGDGRFYWHGSLRTRISGECRRCLAPVSRAVTADIGVLFTQDPDALEDPDSYPLPPEATVIDLTPAVREELLLAVPQYLECRPECRGLCPRCGQDLNAGPCGCAPATVDLRWATLAALKGKRRD